MSTDLIFAEPLTYREVLASLPEGVSVLWSFEPGQEGFVEGAVWDHTDEGRGKRRPCYVYPIAHVLLVDKCQNTLWMREASEHDVKYNSARAVGEAAFEKYGMQGSIMHFGQAFDEQGRVLVEDIYAFEYGKGEDRKVTPMATFDPEEDFGTWDECGLLYVPREGRPRGDDPMEGTCYRCPVTP